jgi:monofunctional glycosyltransferase
MIGNIFLWCWRTIIATVLGSILVVAVFRIVPPAITPLMVWRCIQAPFLGTSATIRHQWVSSDHIARSVRQQLVAREDGSFYHHEGINWRAVDHAKRVNPGRVKRGKPPLGASTISMQTAKNVFLVPWRSMIRKGFEVYFTYLIEYLWGKDRILEVYMNMIEWGNGVYGIEMAAQTNFSTSAQKLTPSQASRLCAIVPNPRKYTVNSKRALRKR